MAFVEEVMVAEFVAEEAARNVDLLAADDDDLLAREDLLGDNGGQPTQEMALAVNDNRTRGEGRHSGCSESGFRVQNCQVDKRMMCVDK